MGLTLRNFLVTVASRSAHRFAGSQGDIFVIFPHWQTCTRRDHRRPASEWRFDNLSISNIGKTSIWTATFEGKEVCSEIGFNYELIRAIINIWSPFEGMPAFSWPELVPPLWLRSLLILREILRKAIDWDNSSLRKLRPPHNFRVCTGAMWFGSSYSSQCRYGSFEAAQIYKVDFWCNWNLGNSELMTF